MKVPMLGSLLVLAAGAAALEGTSYVQFHRDFLKDATAFLNKIGHEDDPLKWFNDDSVFCSPWPAPCLSGVQNITTMFDALWNTKDAHTVPHTLYNTPDMTQ